MDMHDIATTLGVLGRGLPTWLGLMTLWTGGLLVLAWLTDWSLRRVAQPGLRMALYAVVLIRVALPVDWQTPVGVLGDDAVQSVAGSGLVDVAAAGEAFVVASESSTLRAAAPVSAPIDGIGVALLAVYLVVAVALLIVVLRRLRGLGVVLAASTATTHERGVPVHAHAHAGPMVVGLRRPTIVVPRALLESTATDVLAAVLRHEHAHVHHRDSISALAMALLCAIAWPLVPVWIAVARMRLLMELRADAAAVQACDAPVVRGYRRLLLELAQQRWPAHVLAPGLDPVAALRARLAAMTNRPRTPWLLQLAFVGPLAGALLVVAARRSTDPMPVDPEVEHRAAPALTGSFVPPYPHCREHAGTIEVPVGEARRAEDYYVSGLDHAANGRMADAAARISEAAWQAARRRHELLAGEAAAAMVLVLHGGGPKAETEALAWSRHAEASIHRSGRAGPMAIEMYRALAAMAERDGDAEVAATHLARAEAIDAACEVVSPFAGIREG
jgi:beta-lactamase regulating signal transducer with metallopeptidase domain